MKQRPLFVVAFIVILGGLITWGALHSPKPSAPAQPRPIAVEIATVTSRDVPIWLTGIGNVQANNTVTVRPRVSGQLKSVQFTEGQTVKAGDILAQIDPRPYRAVLDQALAQKAQDEAKLANDQREYNRTRDLVETNVESRQLLDQSGATLAQSKALVQASEALVETARLNLDFTAVRSPIDGRTGMRLVDAGNLVTASQTDGLVVITQTKPITVLFTLPQQNFAALQRGIQAAGSAPLPVEVLDDAGHTLARGHLQLIDNQIDATTGTIRLKATFPNDDQTLWPGQFVNARVLVQTLPQALTLPSEAVQPGLDGPFVYVVKPDSTVGSQPVKLGPTVDDLAIVISGLSAGDQVVREGQNKLQPDDRVAPVKAGKSPASIPAAASAR